MVESHPKIVGPYKILDVLGEGGMGTVYLAEQKEPIRRRVALKIIKLGMDTKEVVARFEVERQALAMMNHPNIAKVFDAGATPEGRPYFVMEHVPGVPITEYCDKQKLGIEARLELFRQVCRAVQHAHQNGVMHRDLKPSNILVQMQDVTPTPKVIDFGVAKATHQHLTERTLFTEQGRIIGTPEYMSPEQAEMTGLNVDTRTDVYSLGVLLYEILTGALPFDAETLREAGYLEIQRRIREEHPPRPSTRVSTHLDAGDLATRRLYTDSAALVRSLRGDLDWITMKALEKDPARRYQTASELALDVERHVRREPVEAGPPSFAYRARKLVQRHRGPVLAGLAVVGALAVGLIASLWLYYEADRARAEARVNEGLANDRADEARRAREASEVLRREREAALERVSREREKTLGLLLAHQSTEALSASPALALLLAIESAERVPGMQANSALLAALDGLHEERFLVGHSGNLMSVGFSPDGRRVVTGSQDRTARVWDTVTGNAIHVLRGHTRGVRAVFAPSGETIATCGDRTVRLWDARTGRQRRVLQGPDSGVYDVKFSPDGSRLLGCCDGEVRVWSAEGEPIAELRGQPGPGWSEGVFSPDGSLVLSWGRLENVARLWSATDGALRHSLEGHTAPIGAAGFALGGRNVVTASEDGTARVWDVGSGHEVGRVSPANRVAPIGAVSLTVSPDGATMAVGFGTGSRIVDVASAKTLRDFRGCFHPAYRPGGGAVLFTSTPKSNYASLWSIETGEKLAELTGCVATECVFDPQGERVLSNSSERRAVIWSVRSGLERRTFSGSLASPPFEYRGSGIDASRGCLLLLGASRRARLVDEGDGRVIAELSTPEKLSRAVFSPGGDMILTAGEGMVRLFSGDGTRELRAWSPGRPVNEARFTPDGRFVITVTGDGLQVWDPATGERLRQVEGRPDEVVISADAAVAVTLHGRTGEIGSTLRVWRGDFSEELRRSPPGLVETVALGPRGERMLVSGQGHMPELLDAVSGRVLGRLEGHQHSMVYGEFSADGERLLTASFDGTVRTWDPSTRREVFALRVHDVMGSRGDGLFAVGDSLIVTSSSITDQIQVWSAATGEALLRIPECSRSFAVEAGRVMLTIGNTTKVWPLAPLAAARIARPRQLTQDERRRFGLMRPVDVQAAGAVETLFEEYVLTEDVLAALASDNGLAPDLRAAAIELALERSDPSASELNNDAWRVVARSDASAAQYREALRKVEAACRLQADSGTLLNTLGVAQYRVGAHADALATLRRSDEVNTKASGPQPADVAFLAMTLYALGEAKAAEAERARLRALMQEPQHASSDENRAFVREVDARLGR